MLPQHILTRRATGCDIFVAARTLHVLKSSWLANPTRHRWSNCWPWPCGLVVQVRVVKSGTSILSRSDWPSSQVAPPGSSIPIPSRCSATASAVSGAPNNPHHRVMSGLSDLHGPGSPSRRSQGVCGTGKSSRLSFFLSPFALHLHLCNCIHGRISRLISFQYSFNAGLFGCHIAKSFDDRKLINILTFH